MQGHRIRGPSSFPSLGFAVYSAQKGKFAPRLLLSRFAFKDDYLEKKPESGESSSQQKWHDTCPVKTEQ
jgi:hypothetical protein